MTRKPTGALCAAALCLAATGAQAVTLVGLTSANELVHLNTAALGGEARTAITGLAAGERLVGIDTRPRNGLLYGVSTQNRLYTLDEASGAASLVAALGSNIVMPGLGYGIDFNPVADAGTGASLRFTSSAGHNYAINANTGAVTVATALAGSFSGVSYSNSRPLQAGAPASTALYYIDSSTDTLSRATAAFNNPTLTAVGALGVDVLKANGFEVLANGQAFAALNVDDGSLDTGLYSIDLMSGAAQLVGRYNGTLAGLTVSAVPEPASTALLLAGLLGVAGVLRRRRAG
jgi:hypothetical protein